jgi:hypothetical protein
MLSNGVHIARQMPARIETVAHVDVGCTVNARIDSRRSRTDGGVDAVFQQ